MNIEIKPCPFCGKYSKIFVQSRVERSVRNMAETDRIYFEHFSFRCSKCHARGPVVSGWTSYDHAPRTVNYNGKQVEVRPRSYYAMNAAQAWNRRQK